MMSANAMRGLATTRWPTLLATRASISNTTATRRAISLFATSLQPSWRSIHTRSPTAISISSPLQFLAARPFTTNTMKLHNASIGRLAFRQRTRSIELPLDRRKLSRPLSYIRARLPHIRAVSRRTKRNGRNNSSTSSSQREPRAGDGEGKTAKTQSDSKTSAATKSGASMSTAKHLTDRLPNMSYIHRPTKEELLAAATGFWSRLKVRFKWFSIRSGRPFNSEEIFAMISWLFLGHMLWIILGTTTFVSIAILAVNTVSAQDELGRWIGNYLTKSSGVKIVFESAIVPRWKDGVISFKNVFVSKRPGQGTGKVSKGSPETAAAAAAALVESGSPSLEPHHNDSDEHTNYTQYDLTLDTVNVTLSFAKWFNGKGLLRDVEIKGVRGVIDRTHVHATGQGIDPKSLRHEHSLGDFEIDSFKMDDLLVTVHQPGGFRPFPVSIFSCDLPQLRMQWIFYDFLSANNVSGSFDESLFTIHPRQMHGRVWPTFRQSAEDSEDPWKKHSRLRIDGLKIDHLNRGVEGPFSWIREGNVDVVADVLFPTETDKGITKVVTDVYDQLEATVTSKLRLPRSDDTEDNAINNRRSTGEDSVAKSLASSRSEAEENRRFLVMDLRVNLNDVRAAVPIFTRDLSYVNNALIRPIVAYINTRRTFIPINCRVVKRVNDFDGSWTIFDSGLMDDLSAEVWTCLLYTRR